MLAHMGLSDDVTVEEIVRLGKYDTGSKYPHVLRVQVTNERQKWKVVGKGTSLRGSAIFPMVFVKPDLNEDDRKKDKELVEELKHKRENETTKNWVIRRGRVIGIPKPPVEQGTQQAQQTN